MKKKYLLFLIITSVMGASGSLPPHMHNTLAQTPTTDPAAAPVNKDCAICANDYDTQDHHRIFLDCSRTHELCLNCLATITAAITQENSKKCPFCRAPIQFNKTITQGAHGEIILEGKSGVLTEANEAKLLKVIKDLAQPQYGHRRVPVHPVVPNPSIPRQNKPFATFFRNYVSEAGVGFLFGLLMSGEFKKTEKDETGRRALNRTLYLPAALCGNALLNKYKPERRWNGATISSFALGFAAGIFIPHIGKK